MRQLDMKTYNVKGFGTVEIPEFDASWGTPAEVKLEHIQILAQGAEKWNRWREANPEEYVILNGVRFPPGIDLRGYDLRHISLRDASLVEADLSGARLGVGLNTAETHISSDGRMATLTPSANTLNLMGADLTGAKMEGTQIGDLVGFMDTRLVGVSFTGIKDRKLSRQGFSGADLTDVDFSGLVLDRTAFVDVRLVRTKFIGSEIKDAKFWGVRNMQGADFTDATFILQSSDAQFPFRDADLTGVIGLSDVAELERVARKGISDRAAAEYFADTLLTVRGIGTDNAEARTAIVEEILVDNERGGFLEMAHGALRKAWREREREREVRGSASSPSPTPGKPGVGEMGMGGAG